jgi:PAS domain S-box-containing protein
MHLIHCLLIIDTYSEGITVFYLKHQVKTVKIRYKILVILGLIMICLLGSLYYIAQTQTFTNTAATEEAYSLANAARFDKNLDVAIGAMNNTVCDWAIWDDTYRFVEDSNMGFIDSNMMNNTFETLKLNMMLFFNQAGQLVYGEMYDLSNNSVTPLKQEIATQIAEECLTNDSIQSKEGMILLNGKPMLVAAHTILTSNQEGPTHGTLVIGRYLDYALASLSTSTGLPVSIFVIGDTGSDVDFQTAAKALTPQTPLYYAPLNETHMAGYALLQDISGKPVAIAKVTDVRISYGYGKAALTYVALALIAIIAVIFIVIAVLLDKLVISRLSDLNDVVTKIRVSGDNSKRVNPEGHDELSSLSQSINEMLDAIDKNTSSLENTVKERTKNLVENQKKLESILLASPDAIIATDINGIVTECNHQVEEISGFDRQDLLGKLSLDFVAPDAQLKLIEEIQALARQNGRSMHFETRFIKKDGSNYPAEFSVNLLRNELDEPTGFVGIIRDLSEKKQLEKRLLKAQRMAAIGELAGMVGHDIRNPLAAIRNAAFFLKKKCGACNRSDIIPMLEIIDKSIDHADKIVGDLLEYSRELHLDLVESSPKQLLNKALTMIKIPKNIHLIDLTDDAIKLRVDEGKAVRVYINLIKNAVDAMPEGGSLKVKSSQEQGQVLVSFADTGVGIPPDVLQKIFTPLFTTKAQGMGFGLSISKRIIKAHGGKIWVESEVGKGTTFTVAFPSKTPTILSNLSF